MRFFTKIIILPLLVVLFLVVGGSAHSKNSSPTIQPTNSNIHYMGRFTKQYQFGWTATAIKFRTNATDINIHLTLEASKHSALQIVINGKAVEKPLIISKDSNVYRIAKGLDTEENMIEVWKRTEGYMGQIRFEGLTLNTGARLLYYTPFTRKIMVLGDSISCGYGNEAKSPNSGNTVENENGYLAYGPITARALDAQIMNISWSGSGMFRTRSIKHDQDNIIPAVFDRVLPLNKTVKHDHSKYVPAVIVINLGTNDISRGSKSNPKPELTKENYIGAYKDFIKRLRVLYPNVKIIAAIGPMKYEPMAGWLDELSTEMPYVHAFAFPKSQGKHHLGGHYHPSVAMHKLMADALTAKIKEVCGW